MKKIVLAMLLVTAVTAFAQTTPAPAQPASPQNPTPAPAAPQKKEIKDPAEYNAYVGSVQQTDAAAKVSGLEAFLTQYPNSVMKEDALELLMGAYHHKFQRRGGHKRLPGQGLCQGPAVSACLSGCGSEQPDRPARHVSAGP